MSESLSISGQRLDQPEHDYFDAITGAMNVLKAQHDKPCIPVTPVRRPLPMQHGEPSPVGREESSPASENQLVRCLLVTRRSI